MLWEERGKHLALQIRFFWFEKRREYRTTYMEHSLVRSLVTRFKVLIGTWEGGYKGHLGRLWAVKYLRHLRFFDGMEKAVRRLCGMDY